MTASTMDLAARLCRHLAQLRPSAPKSPLSHSSGLHERVRLYRSQFPRIYRSFGYERLGPMRRDFSIVLEEHGLDLEQALHHIEIQPDYSMTDHARDLAGALRWNAIGALRRRR